MLTNDFSFAMLCDRFAKSAERLEGLGEFHRRELARGMVDGFLSSATARERLSVLRQVPQLNALSCRRFPDGPLSSAVESILIDALARGLEPMEAADEQETGTPATLEEFEDAIHDRAAHVLAAHVPAGSEPTEAMLSKANDDLAAWCLACLETMPMGHKIDMLLSAPNVETMTVNCPGQGDIVANVIHLALMEAVVIGDGIDA